MSAGMSPYCSVHDEGLIMKLLQVCMPGSVRFSSWLVHAFPGRNPACMFWNEFRIHVFCYPVQYESFEQLVGVASREIGPLQASVVPLP